MAKVEGVSPRLIATTLLAGATGWRPPSSAQALRDENAALKAENATLKRLQTAPRRRVRKTAPDDQS